MHLTLSLARVSPTHPGTFFTEGSGKGVVFQTGDHTFLGTIASAAIGAAQPESTLQRELHYFVKTMAGESKQTLPRCCY